MKVFAALCLAFVAVQAFPRPDSEHFTYDNNNGQVSGEHSTDVDGVTKTEGLPQNAPVIDPAPVAVPLDDVNDGDDDDVTTVTRTGSFQQSSSSSSTSTDADGNQIVSGTSDSLSGEVNGQSVNDHGKVSGNQVVNVNKCNSSLDGVNGVNTVKNYNLSGTDASAVDADGVTDHQVHVDIDRDV
ncbi:uncharacterized protein LOC114352639 [Ostrinia furnacalis]|uniref:uncharacterized protein LOC114352639 n=1 Tax=Ostrinia furnacalis TaxID=93504 RepID=UPI0010389AF0|nr:uncharacterized protein LOC114352639 [Ostrinia furnacalis]